MELIHTKKKKNIQKQKKTKEKSEIKTRCYNRELEAFVYSKLQTFANKTTFDKAFILVVVSCKTMSSASAFNHFRIEKLESMHGGNTISTLSVTLLYFNHEIQRRT